MKRLVVSLVAFLALASLQAVGYSRVAPFPKEYEVNSFERFYTGEYNFELERAKINHQYYAMCAKVWPTLVNLHHRIAANPVPFTVWGVHSEMLPFPGTNNGTDHFAMWYKGHLRYNLK